MAAMEAAVSLFLPHPSSSSKSLLSPTFINLFKHKCRSNSIPLLSHNFSLSNIHLTARKLSFERFSTAQEIMIPEETQETTQKRKLYVFNLPWSLSVVDIKNLFGQCGTVTDVEIIKQKNGRSRGFAFVTLASGEEAQAAIDKLDSHEVSGRIIRVEFAKRLKPPSPPSPTGTSARETRHKIYVSNLAWKVRSTHLREFFSTNFSPVSSRVVFDSPTGRSSGYGFVSFATREEAEAAISALDGKELMGRPLRLKFSDRKTDESESENQEEENVEDQSEQ
ncbi:ribonucleoprotein, chloroplast, putative [Ricinus communis]|uniref:Ribonucleoprotein, chloroplast, putative n=1 Tax=Ricinus communis TaxID=3988 RepID=B9SNU9_RICCO|nr:ribonucleoprotein, chloroplast, putative [Ricinus communis]|eukprot:XP_002527668.1 28 kDa ribonucleoprotein, chloroplastic isoform X1 [Ricinus communis]